MLPALLLCIVAAAPPKPLPQPALDAAYPGNARADLNTLSVDVIACCRELWPGDPPAGHRPIVILHRAAGPLTDSTADPKVYRIYLSVTERFYAQFVYQFAHEWAHVMLDPRRTNGLVETLAVAFSLDVLDAMSRRWAKKAPYPNWISYAPEFTRYRKQNIELTLQPLPLFVRAMAERKAYDQMALYLRYRRSRFESDSGDRSLQHLASLALLAKGVRWGDLTGVAGLTDPPPSKDARFRGDLLFDSAKIPALFRQVGIDRDTDFVAAEFDRKPDIEEGLILQDGPKKWLWLHETKDEGKSLEKLIRERKPTAIRWERRAKR